MLPLGERPAQSGCQATFIIPFDESETDRILAIAERYASFCRQHGREPPRDPMRALLAAAEAMALRLEYIATAYEHAQWQADGGVTN